jgi:hypothetical protein
MIFGRSTGRHADGIHNFKTVLLLLILPSSEETVNRNIYLLLIAVANIVRLILPFWSNRDVEALNGVIQGIILSQI